MQLPGGITWGSTINEVAAAYGEPEEEPYHAGSYYQYEYKNDDNNYIRLTIYEDDGVEKIEYVASPYN